MLGLTANDLTVRERMSTLRLTHTFNGVTYTFTYPVVRSWARWYLRNREGVKGI